MKKILIMLGLTLFSSYDSAWAEQTEQPFTSYARYSAEGVLMGKFSAKAGSVGYLAERYSYDDSGRLITIEKGSLSSWQNEITEPLKWPLQKVSSLYFEYDDFGRKNKETLKDKDDRILSLTEFNYDAQSRVRCQAQRMKLTTTGDACATTNASGINPDRITRFTYDELDQVTKEERGVGTDKEQVYKTAIYDHRKLQFLIDANCNTTEYAYDEFIRLQYTYYPDKNFKLAANQNCGGAGVAAGRADKNDFQEFRYDGRGNKTFERKRNGKNIIYQYDNNSRLILKDYQDNDTLHDVAYEYDLRGLQTKARFDTLNGEGITNEFDGFGNLVSASQTLTGVTRSVKSTYDLNNNRESITHPDGKIFYYAFDGINRVTGVGTNNSNREELLSVQYQANGRRDKITRANGSTTAYSFLNGVQLSSFSQSFISNSFSTISYDLVNRFEYNAAGQLTLMGQSNKLYNYTGNEDRTGAYVPDGLNRYGTIAGQSISYDKNSNLASDGTSTYTYDDENRLITAIHSGASAQFLYDPNGRLFQYVVNGNVHQFLYDGDALIGDYVNGVLQNRFVHGDQVDEPWIRYSGSKISDDVKFYLHSNHQGSIIAESSQTSSGTGSVVNTLAYDAYGIAGRKNVGLFGYTGQVYLNELGLYYYKARIYSPKLGRFLQTDPVGYKDDMNLYAYVGNDPVNKIDPSGMSNCAPTDKNCVETPESASKPGDPPPKNPEAQKVEEVVVTAHRERAAGMRFNIKDEMFFVADANGISERKTEQQDKKCSNGRTMTVTKFKGGLSAGQAAAHTHSNSHQQIPGPGDGAAARQSTTGSAYMMTKNRVFSIEAMQNGTFRTSVAEGPSLSDSERGALSGYMQGWENPASGGTGGCN